MENNKLLLEMKNISKIFPGVKALDNVSFDLKAGEIHCIIGENGAGKSTLIKCLGGVNIPEEGQILINGEDANIRGPLDSVKAGIGIIYQEFNLVPGFTIGENVYLNREPMNGIIVDRKKMEDESTALMKRLGVNLDGKLRVSYLTTSQQQMVEICKSLSNNVKIIVFDEPTAVLTEHETELLFKIINQLREEGVGIVYITHRLDEVLELADRVSALRDGKYVGTVPNDENLDKDKLVAMMVGRTLEAYYPERHTEALNEDEVVFEIKNFNHKKYFHNVSFQLHKGEILGLSGLVGAGRTETMLSIMGVMKHEGGEVYLEGKQVPNKEPRQLIEHGIALLPEDRKNAGLILSMSVAKNLVVPNLDQISRKGVLSEKLRKEFVERNMKDLMIKPNIPDRLARDFSGGNQQKVIIAKWLARKPKVLLLDEPTRGIDVNAKAEIYNIINDLTLQGMSIVMVSSEMPELMGCCDRILVMYEGRICGEFFRKDGFDEQEIGRAQAGAAAPIQ